MESTITVKGQVTIPKAMREYLGLEPGDKVVFTYLESGGVRIQPAKRGRRATAPKGRFTALRGRAARAPGTDVLMELLRGYGEDATDPGFREQERMHISLLQEALEGIEDVRDGRIATARQVLARHKVKRKR